MEILWLLVYIFPQEIPSLKFCQGKKNLLRFLVSLYTFFFFFFFFLARRKKLSTKLTKMQMILTENSFKDNKTRKNKDLHIYIYIYIYIWIGTI